MSENNDTADKSKRKDNPDEMHRASQWLTQVCEILDLPQDIQRESIKGVLEVTSAVAHNKSRPAAPVTAFLVGLAAGAAAQKEGDGDLDQLRFAISQRLEAIHEAAGEDTGR